ncbi:hypothetical protein GS531_00045 [Rhodococcus hoagii]|nr:hypothetical protein [Prescottella equi]
MTPMQHLLATGAADLPLPPVSVPPACPGDLRDGTVLLGDRVFGHYLDSRATGIAATLGLAVMFVGALVNLYPALTLLIAIAAGSAALRLTARPTARIQHEHTLRADQLEPGMWVRIRTSLAAQVHQVVRASNTYTLTVTLGTGETKSWDSSMSVSVVELEGH